MQPRSHWLIWLFHKNFVKQLYANHLDWRAQILLQESQKLLIKQWTTFEKPGCTARWTEVSEDLPQVTFVDLSDTVIAEELSFNPQVWRHDSLSDCFIEKK